MPPPDIHPRAKIHRSVKVGPFTVIEADVAIGAGTVIGSHAAIFGGSRIGKGNRISAGVQIGADPQDYHFKGEGSKCVIGDRNVIREYATVSRATGRGEATVIGDDNFIMTYVHVAHNDRIGDHTIICSGTQLGGYVSVEDHCVIGGLCGVHQHCRIGRSAMLGAKSYLNQDLAPYLLARGNRARVYGINVRGLRKQKFTWREIEEIKEVYRRLGALPLNLKGYLTGAKKEFKGKRASEIIDFYSDSRRGVLTIGLGTRFLSSSIFPSQRKAPARLNILSELRRHRRTS